MTKLSLSEIENTMIVLNFMNNVGGRVNLECLEGLKREKTVKTENKKQRIRAPIFDSYTENAMKNGGLIEAKTEQNERVFYISATGRKLIDMQHSYTLVGELGRRINPLINVLSEKIRRFQY